MEASPGFLSAEFPFQSRRASLFCASRAPPPLSAVLERGRTGPAAEGRAPGLAERSRSREGKGGTLSILSSHEERAPKQLSGEDAAATAMRESPAPPKLRSLPHRSTRLLAARFHHERKVLSVVSFSPPLAPDLAWKGRRGPGGVEEGGSYPLLIYLFSSFLPQVAMVIPSSLSLRTRRAPLREHPRPLRHPCPPGEAVPSLTALIPASGSSPRLPPALRRLPSAPPRLPAASPAPRSSASSPRCPPGGEVRREQPKQHRPPRSLPPPRSQVLPGSGTAAEAPLGRGRPGGTRCPVAPARGARCRAPEPGGSRRSPSPVAAAAEAL